MFRAVAAIALLCTASLPQDVSAATFVMTDLWDNDPYKCDYTCYFSGNFDATDKNRDGYITTEEVDHFDAQASYLVIRKSTHFEYFVTAQSENPVDTFEITYKIGDPLIDNLRFTSNDYERSCASEKNSSVQDVLLKGDNTFVSNATESYQQTYPFYDPYTTGSWCGKDYGDGDYKYFYHHESVFGGFQAGVTDIIGDPTPAPVPLPASGVLLLGALGLTGAALRKRRG
jgi:hypothetical protein